MIVGTIYVLSSIGRSPVQPIERQRASDHCRGQLSAPCGLTTQTAKWATGQVNTRPQVFASAGLPRAPATSCVGVSRKRVQVRHTQTKLWPLPFCPKSQVRTWDLKEMRASDRPLYESDESVLTSAVFAWPLLLSLLLLRPQLQWPCGPAADVSITCEMALGSSWKTGARVVCFVGRRSSPESCSRPAWAALVGRDAQVRMRRASVAARIPD